MTTQTIEKLSTQHCAACEGEADGLSPEQIENRIEALKGWKLIDDGAQIRKTWEAEDFLAGMKLLNQVADLAEQEGHHPDLHLEGYKKVRIVLSTHAVGGLSENDFIMAAKIDRFADQSQLKTKG